MRKARLVHGDVTKCCLADLSFLDFKLAAGPKLQALVHPDVSTLIRRSLTHNPNSCFPSQELLEMEILIFELWCSHYYVFRIGCPITFLTKHYYPPWPGCWTPLGPL